jgi:D-amino-acid dehydrogenase
MSGFMRYAGTLEFSGVNHDIRRPRLDQLTKSAALYLREVEDQDFQSEWCGLRPCLPDGYPAVGPVPSVRGLYAATGHAMLGLTLGPVTGQLMAEMILDGKPSIDVRAFAVERFM